MKKIAIIGPCGTGKSTLAKQLGEQLRLPIHHLDTLYFKPGWVEIGQESLVEKQKEIISKSTWIIDGTYGSTLGERVAHADTIIYLDLPRIVYFTRIFKRYLMYRGKNRPDMAEGCEEKLDWEFIRFVWNFKKNNQDKIDAALEHLPEGSRLIRLKTRSEVISFRDSILNMDKIKK